MSPTFFYVAVTIPGTRLLVLGKGGAWSSKDMNILVTVQVTLIRSRSHPSTALHEGQGVCRDIVVAPPPDKGLLQNCRSGPVLEDGVCT